MSKPICYVGISMHPGAYAELEKDYEITLDESRLRDASAAIVYGVPEEWVYSENTQKLKAIGCHSCNDLAGQWASERKILLTFAKSLWRTVAEHTLALMMTAARNIVPADRAIREGHWNSHHDLKVKYSGSDFQNKTIGIWGMGQIGAELAGLLSGFGMRILYNDLNPMTSEQEKKLGISFSTLEDMLPQSDYFCVLIPLNEKTKGAFGELQFKMLKKGCVFVNTARAGIIDEISFMEALKEGIIAAAAMDVFWNEAAAQDTELTSRENVVLTPHLGGSTFECDMALVKGVIQGI
jgi:phosphoglycerate dehydrogenase-like enzyme